MLTPTQLTTLKNDILADSNFNGISSDSDGNAAIAAFYNLNAAPDFWVWRSKVARDEIVGSASVDGTNFSWTGTGFITRTQGERDAFNQLFDGEGFCDPSQANVRQAFLDIFSGGTAPAPANRTHIATIARRKATRAEKLFATGTGSTGSPGQLVFEGALNLDDVDRARSS